MAEQPGNILQLVDGKGNLATYKNIDDFTRGLPENITVISIIGPQNSGKSYLLNKLFETNFDTLRGKNWGQTTQGIWIGRCTYDSSMVIMDIEGADSTNRVQDGATSFDIKAAFFALKISHVVLVNLGCQNVGQHNGGCVPLQRMIFLESPDDQVRAINQMEELWKTVYGQDRNIRVHEYMTLLRQYYTSIFVGNPPRPYYLDVDTGSDLTWIQCDAPCASCAKGPHPLYKPAKGKIVPPRDSLCQELQGNQNYCATCRQCDYEIEYADRSSSVGVLARDEMHLITSDAEREKLSFVFGCAYDQRGQLLASPAKTDGILGLSGARISLPSQLADQGVISNIIGHCITSEPSGGGYLFLGDDYVPRWGVTWVSSINSLSSLYHTSVQKLRYGDQELSAGVQRKVIFDSGSSYTYLPNDAYTKLVSSLKSISSLVQDDSDKTLPLCWKTDFPISSVSDVKKYFKHVTLHFANRWFFVPTTYVIPPEGYLVISEKGNVCLGMLNGMDIQHGSTIILGDISLRGKLVIYDNEQNRIGWVQSNCIRPQKTDDFPFLF